MLDVYDKLRTMEVCVGFKEAKRQVLDCLNNGYVLHQQRSAIDSKNLLAIGEMTHEEVAVIIARSIGGAYHCSPHHMDSSIDVHVLATSYRGQRWYIKWYYVEPYSVFISIHH